MRRLAQLGAGAVGCMLAVAGAANGQEGKGEPFELVRTMQSLQDQIVQGNTRAHAAQRALLGQITERFEGLSPERWKDARNARAAVAFVLSGGSARVLRKLMLTEGSKTIDEKLLKGALAYREGRLDEATELLKGLDARGLDPSMGGLVAYVQGELAAQKEPARALAYLDDARLLSPGTIVEEAALRRQIGLLAASGNADRYESLATQYLRRFPNSVYAGGFHQQFASAIARHTNALEPGRLARLESMLSGVEKAEGREVYLRIAEQAVTNGKVEMARFAAAHAGKLVDDNSTDIERARLYEAAALIVTDDFQRGVEMLSAMERAKLTEADAALLDAARKVASQVRRLPDLPGAEPPAAKDAESAKMGRALEQAREAIAKVDDILNKAVR